MPLLETKLRSGLSNMEGGREMWMERENENERNKEVNRTWLRLDRAKENEMLGWVKVWDQKSEGRTNWKEGNAMITQKIICLRVSVGITVTAKEGCLLVKINSSACHLYCSPVKHVSQLATNFEVDGCALLKAPRPRILHFLWSTPILNLTAKLFEMWVMAPI